MTYAYIVAPFAGWVASGGAKFLVHCARERRLATDKIGTYGGLPSTHTTIVTTTVALIGFEEGVRTAAFAAALTLWVIVVMDATGLRRHVGRHARSLNRLLHGHPGHSPLHETVGHRRVEVAAGCALGVMIGYLLSLSTW